MIDKDDYCNNSWQEKMNNRGDFERWLKDKFCYSKRRWEELLKYDGCYYPFWISIAYEAWQHQQKKIDDLQLKLAIKNDMITALNLTIDELKSLNPDVPCPVCGGKGGWYNETAIPEYVPCYLCNGKGTVPLTRAQEYRIRELEWKLDNYINSKPMQELKKQGE